MEAPCRLESNRNLVPQLYGSMFRLVKRPSGGSGVSATSPSAEVPARGKRADALRNQQTLLAAAAEVFVTSGVDAVYRHQVEACAEAGRALLASAASPFVALRQWVDLFVDFLVTKHGLAKALQSDSGGFETLHAWFLDRLVPVCGHLLDAGIDAGEIRPGTHAYELMRGIGNLCIGRDSDPRYDPRRLVDLLLAGLQMRDGQTP